MSDLNTLPDPRHYPGSDSHPLHERARRVLAERELGRMVAAEAELDEALWQLLNSEAAMDWQAMHDGMPDQAVEQVIRSRLAALLTRPAAGADHHALIFALPIVLVAGVRGQHILPGKLPDVAAVQSLLIEHGIFASGADLHLSARLVDAEQMAQISASQLLRWRDALQYASAGLPHDFQESPISVNGDGVYLRFLLGVAMQPRDAAPVVQLNAAPGPWAMALSKLLGEQLKHDALTLFPLPRAPQAWLAALDDGRVAQQQIRFEVFASNALRKLREAGETPVAVLSAHQGKELRVTIGAERNGEEWAGFIWPLGASDRVGVIQQNMVKLLQECHQSDIRIIPDVLPAMKDQLPYFPIPTELPDSLTRH
ncbi:hypothetical protein [Chitinimonas sp.]|uniref:hypothetical protein n=1 Tax=Chitinimonas sp. TaxID=1934313 RepID=UPI0035AEE67E